MPYVLGIGGTVASKGIERTLLEFDLLECQVSPTSETCTTPAILNLHSLNLSLRLGYTGVPYFGESGGSWQHWNLAEVPPAAKPEVFAQFHGVGRRVSELNHSTKCAFSEIRGMGQCSELLPSQRPDAFSHPALQPGSKRAPPQEAKKPCPSLRSAVVPTKSN